MPWWKYNFIQIVEGTKSFKVCYIKSYNALKHAEHSFTSCKKYVKCRYDILWNTEVWNAPIRTFLPSSNPCLYWVIKIWQPCYGLKNLVFHPRPTLCCSIDIHTVTEICAFYYWDPSVYSKGKCLNVLSMFLSANVSHSCFTTHCYTYSYLNMNFLLKFGRLHSSSEVA